MRARARPRRGALGLRGRIVGAVVVTTVATLAVAALALLGPLENSLRHAALNTLERDLKGQAVSFKDLNLPSLPASKPTTHVSHLRDEAKVVAQIQEGEAALAKKLGASVT